MDTNAERDANLANWNDRVAVHLCSDEYGIERYVRDRSFISSVVAFDRIELGDVSEKSLLHLQCHIGTDTLSWARLGAEVTGGDFSPPAIEAARELSRRSGTPGRFIACELHDTPRVLQERFDVVYTGVGALCWIPDIHRWAETVAMLVKPGGMLYLRDGHPMMLSLDWESPEDIYQVKYPYFEAGGGMRDESSVTYAGTGTIENGVSYTYNHGLGETVTSLIRAGFAIDFVNEHAFCEWQAIKQLVRAEDGRWRMPYHDQHLVPLMFSIRARRR